MELGRAVSERRSVRAFLPDAVPSDVLVRVFETAQRAPSWCNIQPWRVYVASGASRARLTGALLEAAKGSPPAPDIPFPFDYPEPYATHRKKCGGALYEAMGVARGDAEGRLAAWLRNFVAFDAPHIAIVGIDRRFDLYGALDVGCWLQTLMLAATSEGLSTCAQASLAVYSDVVRRELAVPDEVKIMFGVGIGFEDVNAAANGCRTTREPLASNIVFSD
jgi:nitroreductase